jgi:hypothetical protein
MRAYMIATAKRYADQYGIWVKNDVPNRQKKLDKLLADEPNPKIRGKARSIINHRYGE